MRYEVEILKIIWMQIWSIRPNLISIKFCGQLCVFGSTTMIIHSKKLWRSGPFWLSYGAWCRPKSMSSGDANLKSISKHWAFAESRESVQFIRRKSRYSWIISDNRLYVGPVSRLAHRKKFLLGVKAGSY